MVSLDMPLVGGTSNDVMRAPGTRPLSHASREARSWSWSRVVVCGFIDTAASVGRDVGHTLRR
jgi:hypothetical protein